jgi:hypothetical protein
MYFEAVTVLYTLSFGNWRSHVLNGAIYALSYDLLNDLDPISLIATAQEIIIAKNGLPAFCGVGECSFDSEPRIAPTPRANRAIRRQIAPDGAVPGSTSDRLDGRSFRARDLTTTPTPVHKRPTLSRWPATLQSHDNANGYAAPRPSGRVRIATLPRYLC